MLVGRFIEVRKRAKPRDTSVKRLFLSSVAALFLATGTASAQQFIGGSGAGIGRSQYAGSSIVLTPRDYACLRANYASTFAMQRCAEQIGSRSAAVRKRARR
jgi:hypothetical protein